MPLPVRAGKRLRLAEFWCKKQTGTFKANDYAKVVGLEQRQAANIFFRLHKAKIIHVIDKHKRNGYVYAYGDKPDNDLLTRVEAALRLKGPMTTRTLARFLGRSESTIGKIMNRNLNKFRYGWSAIQ